MYSCQSYIETGGAVSLHSRDVEEDANHALVALVSRQVEGREVCLRPQVRKKGTATTQDGRL